MRYFLLFLFFLNTSVFGNSHDINDKIIEIKDKYNMVALQVISIDSGEITHIFSTGTSNIENNIRITEKTLYRIASVSKLFTAIGILRLLDSGKLNLNDNIEKFFGKKIRNPYFPETPIRVIDLLNHTSGIYEANGPYSHFIRHISQPGSIPITEYITEGSPFYTKEIWKKYPSGSGEFNYSNLGYGILGTIIEIISEQRFDIFIEENILKPLEISGGFNPERLDTGKIGILYAPVGKSHKPVLDTPDTLKKAVYTPENYKPGTNALIYSPQGGMRTNITGLGNLIKAILKKDKRLFSEKIYEIFLKTHWSGNGINGFYTRQGTGIHITDKLIENETLYGHTGESFGMTSCLYFSPEKKKGFAYISVGGKYKQGKSGFYEHEERLAQTLWQDLKK